MVMAMAAASSSSSRPRQKASAPQMSSSSFTDVSCHVAAWQLLLQRAPPRDLAAAAMACSLLRKIVAEVAAERIADASHGAENSPIPFINVLESGEKYACFDYIKHSERQRVPWGLLCTSSRKQKFENEKTMCCPVFGKGKDGRNFCRLCAIDEDLNVEEAQNVQDFQGLVCSCGVDAFGMPAYDERGRLNPVSEHPVNQVNFENQDDPKNLGTVNLKKGFAGPFDSNEDGHKKDTELEEFEDFPASSKRSFADVVFECGPACGCSEKCPNRVAQRGLGVQVAIFRYGEKGWGLQAMENIARGTFICEYAGELLTTREAQERQRLYDSLKDSKGHSAPHYLMAVTEHLPSGDWSLRLSLDPTQRGNVGRFINHSCDGGNLAVLLVRAAGSMVPIVAFFARRRIEKGEELTYAYGELGGLSDSLTGSKCLCGSAECKNFLPSEVT